MPLDSHSYLARQGWKGKGTALREGGLERPIAIPQKKTLSGLGKDRDEAFPFWDHLFTAAASAIKLKLDSDDEVDSGDESGPSSLNFARTQTGIISNRRPADGTPADTSGTSTPVSDAPRLSLIATAKREAARKGLYSRFFRGPVLGPDPVQEIVEAIEEAVIATASNEGNELVEADTGNSKKKRKRRVREQESGGEGAQEATRRGEDTAKEDSRDTKKKKKEKKQDKGHEESKEDSRRRKEERRLRKAERRARREAKSASATSP